MDRRTVEIYEGAVDEYERVRPPAHTHRADEFARTCLTGMVTLDAGCGPGGYLAHLPRPVIAFDAALAMARRAHTSAPGAWVVNGDLAALPFRRGALGGAWARNTYVHLSSVDLPAALADLHRAVAVGAPVVASFVAGNGEGPHFDGEFPGRFYAGWAPARLRDLFVGAGFEVDAVDGDDPIFVTTRRARTLADTVGPRMRLLVCGLNPSVFSADAGFGFAGPTNRFWKAAVAAGVVSRARDPAHALRVDGVGMTDLVKRATPRSSELNGAEYREGAARVERLVVWLAPSAICFVGLEGWRTAVDRKATAGWQPRPFGGRPAYVMPSTSGLNASTSLDALVAHLRTAMGVPRVAERSPKH